MMLTFISGGAASGKSAFAEELALSAGAKCLFYVATMDTEGPEAEERIKRHREERAGKNFVTVECKTGLEEMKLSAPYEDSLILLEDLGNLVANEQFDKGGSDEEILRRVRSDIDYLRARAEHVIVVGDDIFSDEGDYSEETLHYVRLLAKSSLYTAGIADCVWQVVFGIPLPVKV